MTAAVKSVLIQICSMWIKWVAFSVMQIRPQQIRLSQIGAGQTIPSSAILSRASSRVYMLQQHMAVTCCQGSLSPGLASPAPGQMATHWAPKTNCGAQDTQPLTAPLTLALSDCLVASFSYGSSSHASTPLYVGGLWFNWVSIWAEREKVKFKRITPKSQHLHMLSF